MYGKMYFYFPRPTVTEFRNASRGGKISIYFDDRKNEIHRVGQEKFTEVFLDVLSKEDWVFNPEELLHTDKGFNEVYSKHLRDFHLSVYREFMPQMNSFLFAQCFAALSARDLPKDKIYEELSKL